MNDANKSTRKNGYLSYKIKDYRIGQTLGIGSFGKVKLAIHEPTGRKVAVKIMNKVKMKAINMYEKSIKEISILKSIIHPHIIRLYEVIDTPSDIYIIMEYVTGGELFDYIIQKGRISEDESRRLFQQIISGMEYCYINRICHRDLKPENILLDENNNIKIGDFGLSSFIYDGDFLNTSCGSPNYAAPEVVSGKAYTGPEIDVWSCGVILYALLCGSLPFDDENVGNLFRKIRHGAFSLPGHISDLAKILITKMLTVDPSLRITYKEIRYNAWFRYNLPFYLEPQYYHLLSYKLSPRNIRKLVNNNHNESHQVNIENSGNNNLKIISRMLSKNIAQEGALWAQKQRRHNKLHSIFSRQLQKKIGVLAQIFSNSSIRDSSRRSTYNCFNSNAYSSRSCKTMINQEAGKKTAMNKLLEKSKHHSVQETFSNSNVSTCASSSSNLRNNNGVNIKGSNNNNNSNSSSNASNIGSRQSIFKMLYLKINKKLIDKERMKKNELNSNSGNEKRLFLDKEEARDEKNSSIRFAIESGTKDKDDDDDDDERYFSVNLSDIIKQTRLNNSDQDNFKSGRSLGDCTEYQSIPTESKITEEKLQKTSSHFGKIEESERKKSQQVNNNKRNESNGGDGNGSGSRSSSGNNIATSIKISSLPVTSSSSSSPSSSFSVHNTINTNFGTNRWLLGFEVSGNLKRIIKIVLFTLKSSNYEWIFISSHKLRCRPKSFFSLSSTNSTDEDKDDFNNNSTENIHPSKSESTRNNFILQEKTTPADNVTTIQLFKINPFKYLIDIQIYDGPLITNAFQAFKLTTQIYYNLSNDFYINIF
ncbi:Protein kinase domain protein [Cryptosporidium meleagridis]|uniref:Protein kinase domain protein n=1 Tax=Cryptosporidium meleagridis TaxID=93969 RepID=A0A2P4Z1R7_9CRYT|nr:Protein kinase domain protein [Cryptosporidium meleagridis]